MIRLIDCSLLDEISSEARDSLRKRKNRNFHASDNALANRLLNAVEQVPTLRRIAILIRPRMKP